MLEDALLREAYERVLYPRQNVFSRAVKDFLHQPVVQELDTRRYTGQPGDPIAVRAYDDFRVAAVEVTIYDASGALVERGAAVSQRNGVSWLYTATQANATPAGCRVQAVATDLPG